MNLNCKSSSYLLISGRELQRENNNNAPGRKEEEEEIKLSDMERACSLFGSTEKQQHASTTFHLNFFFLLLLLPLGASFMF